MEQTDNHSSRVTRRNLLKALAGSAGAAAAAKHGGGFDFLDRVLKKAQTHEAAPISLYDQFQTHADNLRNGVADAVYGTANFADSLLATKGDNIFVQVICTDTTGADLTRAPEQAVQGELVTFRNSENAHFSVRVPTSARGYTRRFINSVFEPLQANQFRECIVDRPLYARYVDENDPLTRVCNAVLDGSQGLADPDSLPGDLKMRQDSRPLPIPVVEMSRKFVAVEHMSVSVGQTMQNNTRRDTARLSRSVHLHVATADGGYEKESLISIVYNVTAANPQGKSTLLNTYVNIPRSLGYTDEILTLLSGSVVTALEHSSLSVDPRFIADIRAVGTIPSVDLPRPGEPIIPQKPPKLPWDDEYGSGPA